MKIFILFIINCKSQVIYPFTIPSPPNPQKMSTNSFFPSSNSGADSRSPSRRNQMDFHLPSHSGKMGSESYFIPQREERKPKIDPRAFTLYVLEMLGQMTLPDQIYFGNMINVNTESAQKALERKNMFKSSTLAPQHIAVNSRTPSNLRGSQGKSTQPSANPLLSAAASGPGQERGRERQMEDEHNGSNSTRRPGSSRERNYLTVAAASSDSGISQVQERGRQMDNKHDGSSHRSASANRRKHHSRSRERINPNAVSVLSVPAELDSEQQLKLVELTVQIKTDLESYSGSPIKDIDGHDHERALRFTNVANKYKKLINEVKVTGSQKSYKFTQFCKDYLSDEFQFFQTSGDPNEDWIELKSV